MSAEGSLLGKGALIGDTSTWFVLFVITGIAVLCFIIARYTIQGGKE